MDIVTGIMGLSIALQFTAALFAVRLMCSTAQHHAWGFIALAVSLMTVRRAVTFVGLVFGDVATHTSLMAEMLALSVSICFVVGIGRMGGIFHALHASTETLRESETRYQALVESSIQGMLIHQDGLIRVANKAVAAIFGYEQPSVLVGQDIYVLLAPHEVARLHTYNTARLQGEAVPARYEVQGKRQDGTVVWLEILASLLVWENRPASMVTLLDITAQKEAEAGLATRMQQLDAVRAVATEITQELELTTLLRLIIQRATQLVDAAVGAIYLWDETTRTLTAKVWHGVIEWSGPLTLQLGEGLIGSVAARQQGLLTDAHRLFPQAALAEPLIYRGHLIGVLSTARRTTTYPFTAADLDMLALLAVQAAIAIENAQLFAAVKTQTVALEQSNEALQSEIAERQRMEEERGRLIADLEARNTEMERFTYTVSHDLKSPLITIEGFLNLLEQDIAAAESARMRRDFVYLRSATHTMQRLLDDLLELSRIGRIAHPPQVVALDQLVQEALHLVTGRMLARDVQVEIVSELPLVFCDRSRLLQVFQNLLDNAIKFMGTQPAPRIVIGARQDNTETVCYVRDNGIGIEPPYHHKVFELFQRLNASDEGTGIGLTLVQRIIEVHGGRVWVESAGQNCGSTFYFTLPQHQEHSIA